MPFPLKPSPQISPEQRREHALYLAQKMGPMIHALMLMATLTYTIAVIVSSVLREAVLTPPVALALALPLPVRLAPVLPLLLAALAARKERRPWALSLLALSCVLLLEIGINLNSIGRLPAHPWVLPGLLLPVASSMIWLGRWDFVLAMILCAAGPLPMLLVGEADGVQLLQYAVYMAIAVSLASVLRAFMTRTLFEQFQLERQLRQEASTDDLTGLLLRNRFLELTRLALRDIRQQRKPVCMLYLDADHFKQLNDEHGHAAGDAALKELAKTLRAQMRPTDLVGRVGGEEFAILLPGLSLQQAAIRAERLRRAAHAITRPDGALTVSIGITESRDNEELETLLARADLAMRQAKREGRDRIVHV